MQDVAGEVEQARHSFREGLRLNPGYAQVSGAISRALAQSPAISRDLPCSDAIS